VEIDLRPGMPSLAHFPRTNWLRATRRVLERAPDAALASYDARGVEVLRDALARYLNRARGTVADPARLLVCSGAMQGVSLLARALRARGSRRVAVEDPGYPLHRAALERAGLETVPLAVDADGIDVDALRDSDADAVMVTPAHQFPAGVVLAPQRRAALIEWAREREAIVVEDDYDGEFRYDRQPVGTLQGLAPERVVYLGSASKVLAPGLRLGWLALPDELVGPLGEEKALDDMGCEVLVQLVLAELFEDMTLDRHLRRMRRLYQERRNALVDGLRHAVPDAEVRGVAAGLQALVVLPRDVEEMGLIAAARERAVALAGLSEFRADTARAHRAALVVGYANTPAETIARAVTEIARSVQAVRGRAAA
jgi:GntR family transcriptional regulator/MocR family aminotransferase